MTHVIEQLTSSMNDINQLIERQNPFDRSLVVKSHDVWESKFPDVASINSHISDAIFQGIDQIRSGQRSVLGITLTAERGLGKSHLIGRLRNRIKQDNNSFFVYMSETDYADLNRINSMFLNTLAYSLKQVGSSGASQWQELATSLLNEIYNTNKEPELFSKRLPGILAKTPDLIDKLTARMCQLKPDIFNPYVIQAILWTLVPAKQVFAINWLSGQSLSQSIADSMGLPPSHDGEQETNALSMSTQVLDIIGNYRTVIICFDEVEPKGSNLRGLTTPQVVAALAKDLYSKLKRGILIMAIYPQTWQYMVKSMPQAEAVVDRIGEKVFDLKYLNSDDIVELVSTWLRVFYSHYGLTPPTHVYPFKINELRELGAERPIIRKVLKWCFENWKLDEVLPDDDLPSLHSVEVAFQEQLKAIESNVCDSMENNQVVSRALDLAFTALKGRTIDSVLIEAVEPIQTKAVDKGYLDFRLVVTDQGERQKIGICVLQDSGAKYVSAALKRLVDYDKFDLTRGCLVRSKDVKAHTVGYQVLTNLLSKGGEWAMLKAEDLKPLLAARLVFDSCDDYEITQEQVIEFIKTSELAEQNYLIREILSDPSGQIPDDVIDEEKELDIFPGIEEDSLNLDNDISDLML